MKTEAATQPGLYARLLGPRWDELAEAVRKLHSPGMIVRATGVFRVRRGTNRLARLLAWLAGLPVETDAADLQLIVTPSRDGEEWRRTFDGRLLVSTQWAAGGQLAEHLGLNELLMDFEIVDGSLGYVTKKVSLRLGFLRIPLPGILAPRGVAWERPDGERVNVSVAVHLPIIGLLIAYDGVLTSIEAKPC